MHDDKRMHRNISMENILIMSTNPPKAVVSNYNSIRHGLKHTETCLGPDHLQALETKLGKHTFKVDTWQAGLVVCAMLSLDDQTMKIDGTGSQGDERNAQMVKHLARFGGKGSTEDRIAKVVIRMISRDPRSRTAVAQILGDLPERRESKSTYVFKSNKTPKTSRNSDVKTVLHPADSGSSDDPASDSSDGEVDFEKLLERSRKTASEGVDLSILDRLAKNATMAQLDSSLEAGASMVDVFDNTNDNQRVRIKGLRKPGQNHYFHVRLPVSPAAAARLKRYSLR